MIILWEHPLSPYAQKVKIALTEKAIPFEAKTPGAVGSGADLEEFQNANPRQEVPLFIDGDVQLYDSTIILEYIEDKWPDPALLPADPVARAKARTIEDVMDCHYEPINWAMGEILAFQRAEGALRDKLLARAADQTQSFYRWLEGQLGDADWFNGDQFGWADICVAPFLNGSASMQLGPDEDSAVGQWLARVNERPSVKQAKEAAEASGLGSTGDGGEEGEAGGLSLAAQALEAGLIKREYRDHRLEWMIKSGGLEVVANGLEKDNIRFTADFA